MDPNPNEGKMLPSKVVKYARKITHKAETVRRRTVDIKKRDPVPKEAVIMYALDNFAYQYSPELEERVQKLLKKGADVNERNSWGNTHLHTAIKYKNLNSFKFFLMNGADISLCDSDGLPALHMTIAYGLIDFTEMILLKDREIRFSQYGQSLKEAAVKAIHERSSDGMPLQIAALKGDVAAMTLLLQPQWNADVNCYTHEVFETPLQLAIHSKSTECVKLLLEHHADPNMESYLTPLGMAVCMGTKESINVLLEYGADPNVLDVLGRCPFVYAALLEKVEMMNILVSKTEFARHYITSQNPKGFMPLPTRQDLKSGRKAESEKLASKAQESFRSRDIEDAFYYSNQAVFGDKMNRKALFFRSRSLLELHEDALSLIDAQTYAEKWPNSLEGFMLLARVWMCMKNYSKALCAVIRSMLITIHAENIWLFREIFLGLYPAQPAD